MTFYGVEIALEDGTWCKYRDLWWGFINHSKDTTFGPSGFPAMFDHLPTAEHYANIASMETRCTTRVVTFDERGAK